MKCPRIIRPIVAVVIVIVIAGGRSVPAQSAPAGGTAPAAASPADMVQLREEVATLRQLVEQLRRQVEDLNSARAGAPPVAAAAGARPGAAAAGAPVGAAAAGAPVGAAATAGAGTTPGPRQDTAGPSDLEKQLAAELGVAPSAPSAPSSGSGEGASANTSAAAPAWSPAQPIQIAGGGGKNFLNLSLTALAAGGFSSTPDVTGLESGGHDPNQRGFTVQNVETVFDGAVDPYFKGQVNMVLQLDQAGETTVELEEAFLTSSSLPHNLQVKGGTFFTEFGRLNQQHPHSWDFVDQPLVNGRFLGPDGLRGPGARVSWLMPTPFYSELFFTMQNSQGETAASFRDVPGDVVLGRTLQERPVRTVSDLLYSPRWVASFDLSDTQTLLAGISAAFGPNAAGQDTRSRVEGVDLYWKWKPVNSMAGFPFVKWQTEAMSRHYEADAFPLDANGDGTTEGALPAGAYRDWGGYTQVSWGFRRGWVAGLRWDWLSAERGPAADQVGEPHRWRLSPNLTWFPTEFSKLRLQYNRDELGEPGRGGSADSLWMQVEFILGAHGAHKF